MYENLPIWRWDVGQERQRRNLINAAAAFGKCSGGIKCAIPEELKPVLKDIWTTLGVSCISFFAVKSALPKNNSPSTLGRIFLR